MSFRKLILSTIFAFALWSPLFAEGRRIGIVVGLNDYQPQPEAALPDLRYAARDAELFGAVLQATGFKVVLVTQPTSDGKSQTPVATKDSIQDQIREAVGNELLGGDDFVIVSLHGHGVQFATSTRDETPVFYFCPADADLSGIQTAADIREMHHLIRLDELYSQMAGCRAGTKLLIVDACRNDPTQPAVFRSGLASATLPKLPPPPGGTIAFFSCKQNERAVEDPDLRQGVFSHYLIDGLLGNADQPFLGKSPDGVITLQELSAYVAHQTHTYVKETYNGLKQTPEIKGEYDANLSLVRVAQLEGLTPEQLITLHGIQIGHQIEIDFVKVAGGKVHYAKGIPETFVSDLYVARYPITVGQFRRFVDATQYKTVAELAANVRFDELSRRGYRLGKGEIRNGVREYSLSQLWGLGVSQGTQTLIRDKQFSWHNPGWPQTDEHPVINLTTTDLYAFQEWVQKASYRTARVPLEHELFRVRQVQQTGGRAPQEMQEWIKYGPPLIRDFHVPGEFTDPLYGTQKDIRAGLGTLPVTWKRLQRPEIGGLFSNVMEFSENPLVHHNLCLGETCLSSAVHPPMIAGFRIVIPATEGRSTNEVDTSVKPLVNPPKAPQVDRQALEEGALDSFALANYMQSITAANRKLGGVIHTDYPTAILAPEGDAPCEVWKSKDGKYVFVSRNNETLRFDASVVKIVTPVN